jgi:hypothetical protein
METQMFPGLQSALAEARNGIGVSCFWTSGGQMRWVEITDTTGRVVWINAQNVAYVQDFQTYRAVHFVGSKDNYFQAKDTAEDLVMMLRQPA